MSEVSLTLNVDSLLSLPMGASYHAKSGRASLDVSRGKEPSTVYVYASCDSLQQLVLYYERLAEGYKAELEHSKREEVEEKKPPDNRLRIALIAFVAGLATGIILTIKIKKRN